MYESHFGLSRRPFGETVDPSAYLPLPSREAIVRRVRYGLENGQGPALVFGPAGSGKTLLARRLVEVLGGPAVHLTFPALPPADLLRELADGLDPDAASSADGSLAGSLRRLRSSLASSARRGERPLVLVDEAQLIDDPATFEALRSLQNLATLGPPDVRMVLIGGPEVLLRLPGGFADRLTARCLLGPLGAAEADAYLNGRLAAAGATGSLFDPEAVATLHRAADGLPRRLNRLADLALLVAFADGLPRPDARAVAIAVREADPDVLAA